MNRHPLVLAIALGLLTTGCKSKDGNPDDSTVGEQGPAVRVEEHSDSTRSSGTRVVDVEVRRGETALIMTVEGDSYMSLEAIYDPDGDQVIRWQDWFDDESLTDAFIPWYEQTTINWPVREVDGPLTQGTWQIELASTNNSGQYKGDVDFTTSTRLKSDDRLDRGKVRVRVVFAGNIGDDDEIVAAVEQAVEGWRAIWDRVGVELVETYDEGSDVDESVPEDLGGSEIRNEAAEGDDGDLMLLIVEDIGGDAFTYGIAGGIPWSTEPIQHAAVAVSWLAHAGNNASFSDSEVDIMGETMAHEVGHYIGLYHPVEDGYRYFDALDDTERCGSQSACESALGSNVMFPYPVCDFTTCIDQDELTDDQAGVSHLYGGVL